MSRRPPGRPTFPMTTGRSGPRHLLPRPVGVHADGPRIRRDELDRQAETAQGVGGPVHDGLLGPGDARDPDERRQVGDERVAIDHGDRQARRIGRVMQVGPPEPLTPTWVAG